MTQIASSAEYVSSVYTRMRRNLEVIRRRLGRPLTFTEKILFGHLADPESCELLSGESYLLLQPDRVAMQDATAQMAILQFAQADLARVAVPTTVHCDHLIRAREGASPDTLHALSENQEVYDFLETAARRYGMGFWKPGSGIIHQVLLENYAFPGGMMIGTDSHTPNAGGLAMFASGVGGADAVDVMAGFPWEVKYPKTIGIRLTGKLQGWASPKDVILLLAGILTVKGGTNAVLEYFGPGAATISATGKGTITNMGAELGATTSIFPFDASMDRYLRGTERAALADLAARNSDLLSADPQVEQAPERYFSKIIDIDLSALEPHLVGPHTPDLARPLKEVAAAVKVEGYPDAISVALIGSCTNSSYEDISRVADVLRQAHAHGIKAVVPFLVTPGSEQIRATIERDGLLHELEAAGARVLANACGPCIGQWQRDELKAGEKNTIVTSFNRNFPRRNDGNPDTLAFIGSPEIVAAMALSGSLSFNPLRDELTSSTGQRVRLKPPPQAPDLPANGFVRDAQGYLEPPADGQGVEIKIRPDSKRLQLLAPFAPWNGLDFLRCPLLLKVKGKCTTDHISPAGPWLRFRGHLDNISENMFFGAENAFTGESGKTMDLLTGMRGLPVPAVARAYKAKGLPWIAIGGDNYGEGLQPRTRRDGTTPLGGSGDRGAFVRADSRIKPEKARIAGTDFRGCNRLRQSARNRSHQHRGAGRAGARPRPPRGSASRRRHRAAHPASPHNEHRADRMVSRRFRAERAEAPKKRGFGPTLMATLTQDAAAGPVRVLVADPISEAGVDLLRATPGFDVVVRTGMKTDELTGMLGDHHALVVRSATQVTDRVLEHSGKLRVIGRAGTGVDNIDLDAATRAGVVVLNTPGGNSVAAAELAFSLLLALARGVPQANADLRAGKWERKKYVGVEVAGKVLGVIGLGRIGREVARRAAAFRMSVLGYDPFVSSKSAADLGIEGCSLDDLLARSDFVSLHLPLSAETHHLLNAAALQKMKRGARLVNCARGGLVDEPALFEALQSGHLAGAALDVFETEPPTDRRLIEDPRVISTPHLGALTHEAQERVGTEIAEKIRDFFQSGAILDAVNFPSMTREEFTVMGPLMDLTERLGSFLAQLAQDGVQRLEVRSYGTFADRPLRPLAMAAAKGLLTPAVAGSVSWVNALGRAAERGITVEEARSNEATPFSGLVRLTVITDRERLTAAGTLITADRPRIVEVDGLAIEASPRGHLLFFRNRDVPGVVGRIGSILGRAGINIAGIHLGRSAPGEAAVLIVNADTRVPAAVLAEIAALPEILTVRGIEM